MTGECVKMYKEAIRAAWAEINVSNLDFNIKSIREKVGPDKKITGVIKADGYGHGAVKVANVLTANGINSFAVATLSEAVRLREAGFTTEEIVVLGLTPDPYVDTIVDYGLTPVVCAYSNAEAISKCAQKAGKVVKGLIAVDTGMGRIGYNPDDMTSIEDVKMIQTLPNFKIEGLFSHFATADAADKTYSTVQEQRYVVFYRHLINEGIDVPMRNLAQQRGHNGDTFGSLRHGTPRDNTLRMLSVGGSQERSSGDQAGDVCQGKHRASQESPCRYIHKLRTQIHGNA